MRSADAEDDLLDDLVDGRCHWLRLVSLSGPADKCAIVVEQARRWRWLRFWNSGWQRGWQTPAFGRMMPFIICFNLPFCPLVCLVNTHGALYYHVQPRKQSLKLLDPHAQDLAAGYKHRSILSQRSSFTSPYRYRLTARILKHTTSPICIP